MRRGFVLFLRVGGRVAPAARRPGALVLFAALAVLLPAGAGAVDGSGDKIYWSAETGGAIRVGNPDGSVTASSLFSGEGGPCGVAVDLAAGKIYWANFFSGGVRVANLDGTGSASTLFDGQSSLCGVAIDPAAGKIYWADFGLNRIRVGSLDGSGASTLFEDPEGSRPSGVTVDPANGRIYWANQFSDEVRVGNLDGSGSASTLFGPADAGDAPVGVALAGGKVYLAALGCRLSGCVGSGQIRYGNPDGTGASALFSGEDSPGALAVDPGAGRIYWANFYDGNIRVGNLDGTGATTLYSGEAGPAFPVLLRAPLGTGVPTISGGGDVGQTLTCSEGSWAPNLLGAFLFRAPRSLAYQWLSDGSDIVGANSAQFTPTEPGSFSCRVTAENQAGSTSQTSATLTLKPTLALTKFYDANANGVFDASESSLAGWQIQVGGSYYLTPNTLKLDPGNYAVTESDPTQTNWRHTTASSAQVSLGAHDQRAVTFGNLCLGAGGARTPGFWGNKNGQALFGADDLALMVSLNLRNADGSNFDPVSYTAFSSWLGKVTATNMAYALSVQLAAMELNVFNGTVAGNTLIYAPGTTSANTLGYATVNAVMSEANAELGLHGLTKSGSAYRAYQAALKGVLYDANYNSTFVQATPCGFSFP